MCMYVYTCRCTYACLFSYKLLPSLHNLCLSVYLPPYPSLSLSLSLSLSHSPVPLSVCGTLTVTKLFFLCVLLNVVKSAVFLVSVQS